MFDFALAPVEEIPPWRSNGEEKLSWFALTWGEFRLNAGDATLFESSDAIRAHWGDTEHYVTYQIASLARDILGAMGPGLAAVPEPILSYWEALDPLQVPTDDQDLYYTAFRWLGERSPSTSYFVAYPNIHFIRAGENVRIHWDNRNRLVDGIPVWTAVKGDFFLPAETFRSECRAFADGLLSAMATRIDDSLREEHERWRREFEAYFEEEYEPDIPWDEAEAALRTLVTLFG